MSLRPEAFHPWVQPRAVAVVVIAAAAVWSTSMIAKAIRPPAPEREPTTIDVTSSVTRHVTADHATWTITFHAKADDRDTALAQLHDAVDSASTYLCTHGVKPAELGFQPATVEADTPAATEDGQTPDPTSFDASQVLVIESADIVRIVAAYRGAVVAEELEGHDVGEPTCTAAGAPALEQDMLSEARRDVRKKAKAMVDDYGDAHLGRLVTADPGSFSLADGVAGCTGGEAQASAHATFELE